MRGMIPDRIGKEFLKCCNLIRGFGGASQLSLS